MFVCLRALSSGRAAKRIEMWIDFSLFKYDFMMNQLSLIIVFSFLINIFEKDKRDDMDFIFG